MVHFETFCLLVIFVTVNSSFLLAAWDRDGILARDGKDLEKESTARHLLLLLLLCLRLEMTAGLLTSGFYASTANHISLTANHMLKSGGKPFFGGRALFGEWGTVATDTFRH